MAFEQEDEIIDKPARSSTETTENNMSRHNFAVLDPTAALEVVYELLLNQHTQGERILLHGAPSTGKTKLIEKVGERLGAVVHTIQLLNKDLGSMIGLDRIKIDEHGNEETIPVRPYFLPEYVADEDITDATPRYIIFLDEIMAADDAIRKSAFELLTEHRMGPHRLGKNVYVLGAGNTSEDGTIVHQMDRATRSRFLHIMIEQTHENLLAYSQRNGWHPSVVTLIRNQPGCMQPTEAELMENAMAGSSSRALERTSDIMFAYDAKVNPISKLTRDIAIQGRLGTWMGGLLIEALEDEDSQFDLMNLLEAKPEDRVYPKNAFGLYSLGTVLTSWSDSEEKLDRAIDIMMAIPNNQTDCVEEIKCAFIIDQQDKFVKWSLYGKYGRDERVIRFIAETDEIINSADQAYEERQAAAVRQAA